MNNFLAKRKEQRYKIDIFSKREEDILAFSFIQPLIGSFPLLPFNSSSLRPFCLAYILNEILINKRKKILEFGSGLSTILIARLIKKNNLDLEFYSFEHDGAWADYIDENLSKEGLTSCVKLIKAPLKAVSTDLGEINWYDSETVYKKIKEIKFDLLIIDGPPAYLDVIKYSRYPAMFLLKKNLAKDYCILLDDAQRIGEKEISLKFIKSNPDVNFSVVGQTLAVFRSTIKFDPSPFNYTHGYKI